MKRERWGEEDSEVEKEREWNYYRFQDICEKHINTFADDSMIVR